MAFCPSCGYRRAQPVPASAFEADRLSTNAIPLLIAGVLSIFALSLMLHHQLGAANPARKVWALALLVAGFVAVYASQWWALKLMAGREVRLGGMDWVVVSGRVWSRAANHLPETRWPMIGVCWGMTTMLVAVAVVGGLGEWIAVPPVAVPPGVEQVGKAK